MVSDTLFASRRNVLLFYVASATVLGAIGSILGLIKVLSISKIMPSFQFGFFQHPYLQVFGFLVIFISGVEVVLAPNFRGIAAVNGKIDYIFLGIMIAFQISVFAGNVDSSLFRYTIAASFVFLFLYSLRYNYLDWLGLFRRSRKHDAGDFFLAFSAFSLLLTSILLYINGIRDGKVFNTALLYEVLLGFSGFVVFGVSIKTSPSINSRIRSTLLYSSLALGGASIVFSFIEDVMVPGRFLYVIAVLFLLTILSFVVAQSMLVIKSRKRSKSDATPKTKAISIVSYARLCIVLSLAWLIIGSVIGLFYSLNHSFHLEKIAMIHSIGLGFLGTSIMGYAPLLLPGILSLERHRTDISIWSLLIFTIGIFFMITGFSLLPPTSAFPYFLTAGGFLIVAGMLWYVVDIHRFIVKPVSGHDFNFQDDW